MLRRILLAAARSRALAEHVPRYRFVRASARRFIAGDDVDAALGVAADLARAGAATLVSRLGEDVTDAAEATRVRDHYRFVLDRFADASLPVHISVKLSHLGLAVPTEPAARSPSSSRGHAAGRHPRAARPGQRAARNPSPQRGEAGSGAHPHALPDDARIAGLLADLAAHAARTGCAVWVDMEGSALIDRTIGIFRTVLGHHRNIGICLQAYLHRTEQDLEALAVETTAIRLVKGAYNEPESTAWRRKRDVDAAFHRLALRLLELHRGREAGDGRGGDPPLGGGVLLPALGTHDIALLERIMRDARERGVPASSYEVQMLDGIRVADRRRLVAMPDAPGVRVLVSYGTDWFPWFVRRLAERPANLLLLARSLVQRAE